MLQQIKSFKDKALVLGLFGWLLFPGMYLLVGLLTAVGVDVIPAFVLSSPLGLIGVICWIFGIHSGFMSLLQNKSILVSIVAITIAILPLLFLGYIVWLSAKGY